MSRYFLIVVLLFLSVNLFAGGDPSDGHSHGNEAPAAAGRNTKPYFTVSSVSDKFELVLRYDPIKGGEKVNMRLFVSDFETNKPVDGKIEVSTIEGDLKFTVTRLDSGIYNVAGTFPANKDYDLVANISAGNKADLMTLEHIAVGQELPKAEEPHEEGTGVAMKTILYIGLSFLGGILLTWLLLRRRQNKRTMSIILITISLTIPVQPYQQAFAHGGEDHGDNKSTSTTGKTDELEIPKETQFLFDIETAFAKYSNYNNVVKLYGRVTSTPEGEARIMAPQPSSIVTINVSVGQKVGKGQILAVVEQSLGAAEQVQLEAERSVNQGELEQAKKDYDRLKSLEGIVAKKEIVAAEIRYKTAVQNQKVYSSIASGNGRTFTIKSPIDGVVSNFNLSTGQVLEQGQQLFSIIDNSKLKIEAQVFGNDINKISQDMRFTLDVMNGQKTVEAKLVAFGKMVDPVTQATQLVLETDNPDAILMPGQYVSVNVIEKSAQQQVVVPTSAISDINGKPVIYIHTKPEVFAIRYVQTGEGNNESTVVLKGLKEGERVVVNGAYQVKSIYLNQ